LTPLGVLLFFRYSQFKPLIFSGVGAGCDFGVVLLVEPNAVREWCGKGGAFLLWHPKNFGWTEKVAFYRG
jgi:hypothetical protein